LPKNGYNSVTLPDVLVKDIDNFVNQSNKLISSRSEALKLAWIEYKDKHIENVLDKSVRKDTPKVKIGNKAVGDGEPVFFIAEIGINHNGDVEIAKKLIDIAVETGCDAVKFQKRTVDIVYSKKELERPRENPFGTTNGDLKRGLEFGEKEFSVIDKYCKQKNILWFASCWDYKIASACLTDDNLLKHTKVKGKPVMLSTGLSTIDEIKHAVDILGIKGLIILHCTSTYPSALDELNLKVIQNFKKRFNCPIGYSGHEVGVTPSLMAAVMGSCVIERHITLDRAMWGSDQAASLEPNGIRRLVRDIRQIPIVNSDGIKKVYESELPIKSKLRRVG